MTPNIAKKIAAISAAIPPLAKTTDNREAGFSYVSIDDYYAKVVHIVRDGGLIWTIDEDGAEMITYEDASEPLVRFSYVFTIYDLESGDEAVIRHSVPHPLMGAQTTGSAASYAEKIFLRTLFKIVTGEADADAFAKKRSGKSTATRRPDPAAQHEPDGDGFDVESAPSSKKKTEKVLRGPNPEGRDADLAAQAAKKASPFEGATETPQPRVADDGDLPPMTAAQKLTQQTGVLIGKLTLCKSKLDLKTWLYEPKNKALIAQIKEESPDDHARLAKAYDEALKRINPPEEKQEA